jgi:hypothetical protein
MKRLLIAVCVVVAFFAGVATGYQFRRPVAIVQSTIPYDPAAVFRGKFNEELKYLAFRRAIAVRTTRTGDRQNGAVTIEAKYDFQQPMTESERVLVDRAAQKLWEMNNRNELVGKDLDVLNPYFGVATHISIYGGDDKRIRMVLDWDASKADADICACLDADLKTGKVLGARFTASDGRGWN